MSRSVPAFVVRFVLGLFLVLGVFSSTGWAQTIAFVQVSSAVPSSPESSASATYVGAQTAGDTNVVAIGWNDSSSSVTSVTDTNGNTYTAAVGPTIQPGFATQIVYVGRNIVAAAAGANTVTVTFNTAVPFADLRILEYRGLDAASPVDATTAAIGTGATGNSGPVTSSHAYDLIFGADYVSTTTTNSGNGFLSRVITNPDGDIAEDQIVTATGTYTATAPVNNGQWIMQSVALMGAAAAPPASDPSVVGQWGAVTAWPILPIHVTLMPTGKVLAYGHDST
ncbi:MAG: hypothetical protein ACRD3Q_16515, partial [Terriglobales bacterium]